VSASDGSGLQQKLSGGVLRLILNRPAARNALDQPLVEALLAALEAVDPAVRLVVLQSRGPVFCAGADLHEMRQSGAASVAENRRRAAALGHCFTLLQNLPQVSIARVQGAAVGGGVGLCAACDLVVASDAASFCFTEVRLGLVPAVIAPAVVDALGISVARRLFLSAASLSAREAVDLGLVHERVEAGAGPGGLDVALDAALDAAVDALCARLLQHGPQAMATVKSMLPRLAELPAAARPAYASELLAEVRGGAEAQEGIAAFFARRPPNWRSP
jgi:methylglutaconyl-CoA hydratase